MEDARGGAVRRASESWSALMRRFALLSVLLVVPVLWAAPRKTTVSELTQMIDGARADHLTDAQLNQRLNNVQLTESLDATTWEKLTAESPGEQTTEALRALYANSSFLPPSPGAILADAAPQVAAQREIMASTIRYVLRTVPALPNLLAVRDTAHYTDTGVGFDAGTSQTRGGLLLLGEDQTPVTIRDGVETDTPTAKRAHAAASKASENFHEARDLISWGEFGPVLTTVLLDAAHGQIAWAHWEEVDGQKLAVFHFAVPRSASHYSVHYCCDVTYGPALDGQHQTMIPVPSVLLAGYHGEMTVDPATGVIRRILLTVDPRPGDSLLRGAMKIDWGTITIGDEETVVPLHSVTLTTTPDKWEQRGIVQTVDRTRINETEFSAYHRFGSQAKIVTDIASTAPAASAPVDAIPAANSTPLSATVAQGVAVGAPASKPVAEAASNSVLEAPSGAAETKTESEPGIHPAIDSASSDATTVSAAPAAAAQTSEVAVEAMNEMPQLASSAPTSTAADASTAAAASPATAFTLHATTQRVSVNLLALDGKGRPVTNLRRDEIQILDNGHLVPLSTFQAGVARITSAPQSPGEDGMFTNTVEDKPAADTLILLLDDSHLPFAAMNQARQQVLDFLKQARPGTEFALYAIDEHGFRVLQDVTADPAQVRARLVAWTPSAAATAQAQALEQRDRQEFDTVHHAVDLNSVNGNYTEIPDYIETTDPELRLLGDNPQRQLLEGLQALARHFAAVQGQKSLALVSGDSALGDWEDRAVGMEKGSRSLEGALARARETLNDAHIALYVINASQNGGGVIDSSIQFRNVELIQGSTDNNGPAGATAGRNLTPGRLTGQMQANLHGIDGPVRTLAEATGGFAVDRGANLAKTLDQIQSDTMATAELSFEPPVPPDNQQHTITVKIPDRKGLKLRYRATYLDAAEPTLTASQQLQQAVWNPEDAHGIGLSATADSDADGTTIHLRIELKGLDLRQQDSGPAAGRWTDRLYIFTAARNDGTRQAQLSGDTLVLSLEPATYQSGMPAGIPYHRTLKLPSKLASVRVIVVDRNSGRVGTVTLPASAVAVKG